MAADDFTFDLSPESPWIGVSGGGLERPMDVRVRLSGTALQLVGVRIEGDQEITSATLRSLRLSRLLPSLQQFLVDHMRELDTDVDALRLTGRRLSSSVNPTRLQAPPEWWTGAEQVFMDLHDTYVLRDALREQLQYDNGVEFQPRPRGAKPPTDEEYARFAAIYLEELAAGARGAKQRTADRAGMNRGTAYKWIRECEARGLFTKKGTS